MQARVKKIVKTSEKTRKTFMEMKKIKITNSMKEGSRGNNGMMSFILIAMMNPK